MEELRLISFGFIYGLPEDANTVLDMRGLPNPFWVEELREMNAKLAKPGEAPKFKTDRKSVIDMLRQEKYNKAFRELFRERFGKMMVECPAFPDLEGVDGVSPPR